jgi:hypothetical protein
LKSDHLSSGKAFIPLNFQIGELLMKCRKLLDDVKAGVSFLRREGSGGYPVYCPDGIRHRGGVKLVQAFKWNMGTCRTDVKGEIQVGSPYKGGSADAGRKGGARS